MIYIEWCRHDRQMKIIEDCEIWFADVSCLVRNEVNRWRPNLKKKPADEVIHAITKNNTDSGIPVMPRQFPIGKWNITSVDSRDDEYRKPYIIMTNAFQELEEWKLDKVGGYDKPTGNKVLDYKYGLHFSQSNTTTGCIKIDNMVDLLRLVQSITREFDKGNVPIIEVVA